jgi:hypothetical protein
VTPHFRALPLLLTFLTCLWAAPAPFPRERVRASGQLDCIISADPTHEPGEIPAIAVRIINRTRGDVYLVGSLDGSNRRRYPYCYFEVVGPDSAIAQSDCSGCVFMNILEEDDFVKVPAGGTFNPFQVGDHHRICWNNVLSGDMFSREGQYRVRFVYSTLAHDFSEWEGVGPSIDPRTRIKLERLLAQVPKTTVTSNEIVVEVKKK